MRDTHKLEVIRGRQGRHGIDGMSFSNFLDILWAEIYDDCPPMGDHAEYRRIVTELFIEGKPPHEIKYKDSKGKIQRLSNPSFDGQNIPKNNLEEARKLADNLRQARLAAMPQPDVESDDDG